MHVENKQFKEAALDCHALKGIVANLGGVEFLDVIKMLEGYVKSNQEAKAVEFTGLMLKANEEFVKVLKTYDSFFAI